MNDLVEFAIERNYDRILHSERGEQYDGCEDDLREELRLLAEHGLKYDRLGREGRLRPEYGRPGRARHGFVLLLTEADAYTFP